MLIHSREDELAIDLGDAGGAERLDTVLHRSRRGGPGRAQVARQDKADDLPAAIHQRFVAAGPAFEQKTALGDHLALEQDVFTIVIFADAVRDSGQQSFLDVAGQRGGRDVGIHCDACHGRQGSVMICCSGKRVGHVA